MPTTQSNPTVDGAAPLKRFAIEVAFAMGIFTTLVFIGIFWRTVALVEDSARQQASSYIDLIVDARTWNAGHGGVWVIKGSTAATNPYLSSLGVEPDTSTVSGTQFTLRNPALMTNEISKIASQSGSVRFRLTSLKLVNPDNAPDEWEKQTLKRFETDRSDISITQRDASGHVLRMMRPLIVENSCLRCHSDQGYKQGDVRGAISLTLPLAKIDRSLASGGAALFAVYLIVLAASTGVGYWLVTRTAARVDRYESALQVLATTDPLTGIANRRSVLQRLEQELARSDRTGGAVGVLELDIDHFKNVNDTYGHAVGDIALREVSARIVAALREYDVAGRLGGEEFLVVAPSVDAESLSALAERLREGIGNLPIAYPEGEFLITTSIGATLSQPGDSTEGVFLRADTALYAAKASGRNRVEMNERT